MFDGSYPPGVSSWMLHAYLDGLDACCNTCRHYDGQYCTRDWNNMDRDYCVPHRDERDPGDVCDEYEED